MCKVPQMDFNSIKVRLEHHQGLSSHTQLLFQFHKGAIRTNNPIRDTQSITKISIP